MSECFKTSLESRTFTYTWVLKDFDTNLKHYTDGSQIDSPAILPDINDVDNNQNYRFKLIIFQQLKDFSHMVCIKFINVCRSPSPKEACIRVAFIKSSNEEVMIKEKYFDVNNENGEVFDFRRDSIYANELIINGNLTIKCRIRFDNGPILHKIHPVAESDITSIMPEPSITNDLKNLLLSTNLSDVKLIVDKEEFQVHKSILAARSPVFSAMFQADVREKKKNIVEIDDIEPRVMKEVLNFIYTDKTNIEAVPVTELLVAADKYKIEGLRIICLKAMLSKLDNADDILAMTSHSEIPKLQDYAIDFLVSNKAELVAKQSWVKIVDSLSKPMLVKLALELMKRM